MCFSSEWSRADIINLCIMLTGIGMLCVTIYIASLAKKILPQEATKAQLVIVTTLITQLATARINLFRKNSEGTDNIPKEREVNIFDTAKFNLESMDNNYEIIFSLPLINSSNSFVEAFKHLSNPLLPNKIAECLERIRTIAKVKVLTSEELDKPFFVYGRTNYTDRDSLLSQNQLYVPGGINAWLQACKNLQQAIIEWFKEMGVDKLNQAALRHIQE